MTAPKIVPPAQRQGSFLPTADQHLLLRAALADETDFEARWREWRAAVEARGLDLAAMQIAQLLAPRVRGLSPDPLVDLIREQYRLTWMRTNMAMRRQPALIGLLQAAGVEVLALKGVGLVAGFYGDPGLRAVGDLDILVRPDKVEAAREALAPHGWRLALPDERFDPRFGHALTLEDPAGGSIDVHAHALNLNLGSRDDDIFWTHAVTVDVAGAQIRTMCAAHQLIHQVAHAAAWNVFPAVRWAADCAAIIRSGRVDWALLCDGVERLALGPVVGTAMRYLRDDLDQPIAEDVIARVLAAPISPARRRQLEVETNERPGSWDQFRFHWWRLYMAAAGRPGRMFSLTPDYCRYRLSTGATGVVPSFLRMVIRPDPRAVHD